MITEKVGKELHEAFQETLQGLMRWDKGECTGKTQETHKVSINIDNVHTVSMSISIDIDDATAPISVVQEDFSGDGFFIEEKYEKTKDDFFIKDWPIVKVATRYYPITEDTEDYEKELEN
jgi:hypothetical protein